MSRPGKWKLLKRRLLDGLFAVAGAPLLAAYLRHLARASTLELRHEHHFRAALASGRPLVFAFWHEDMVGIALAYLKLRAGRVAVMVSRSRDGEKLTAVVERLGLRPVRASSSRGAVQGMLEMVRWLRGGAQVDPAKGSLATPMPIAAIALDGPRGPRREAKPGVILLAREAGALIVPCAFAHDRQTVFRSWDRTKLPRRGARTVVWFDSAMEPDESAELGQAMQLADHLNRMDRELASLK